MPHQIAVFKARGIFSSSKKITNSSVRWKVTSVCKHYSQYNFLILSLIVYLPCLTVIYLVKLCLYAVYHKCWGPCAKLQLPSITLMCLLANCTVCTREGQVAGQRVGRAAQPCTTAPPPGSVLGWLLPAAEMWFSALEWRQSVQWAGKVDGVSM